MAEITINDVKFTNVPNKKAGTKFAAALTQSNIGTSQSVQDYMNSNSFYALLNAVDINWNGIEVAANSYINTTSDLIKFIIQRSNIDLSDYATTSYVNSKITELIGAAPETLDTLEELAQALSENANLSYVTEALASKADANNVYTKNEVDLALQQIELTPGPAGADGPAGANGQDGQDGQDGADGLSAYQIAVNNGFVGDEVAWLASLHGQDGSDGQDGANGTNGTNGQDGYTPYIDNTTYNWMINGTDTGVCAKGQDGQNGTVDYSVLNNYVSITSYNNLMARVEQLASWIVSYHGGSYVGPGPSTPTFELSTHSVTLSNVMMGTDVYVMTNTTGIDVSLHPVSWSIDNTSVASLGTVTNPQSQCNIQYVSDGSATLTATLSDGTNTFTDYVNITCSNSGGEYPPQPSKGIPILNLNNSTYGLTGNSFAFVAGDPTSYVMTLNGTPQTGWTIKYDPMISGVTIDMMSSPKTITVEPQYMSQGNYNIDFEYYEDAYYYYGMASFGIKILPVGSDPRFYFEMSSINLDNNMMSSATPMPYNTTGYNYLGWSTSDSNVASVDEYGTIRYVGSGTCTVTCTVYDASDNGNRIASAEITVNCYSSKGYTNGSWQDSTTYSTIYSIDVIEGDNTVKTYVFNGTPQTGWTFSNPMVTGINVDSSTGTITVDASTLEAGNQYSGGNVYSIYANRYEDENYYSGYNEIMIHVWPVGTNLDFHYHQAYVNLDNTMNMTQSPMYTNNTGYNNITYSSSDNNVATVDMYGMISYVGPGSCVVTATVDDGNGNTVATATIDVYCSMNKSHPSSWWVDSNNNMVFAPAFTADDDIQSVYTLVVNPSDGWTILDPNISGVTIDSANKTVIIVPSAIGAQPVTIESRRTEDSSYYEGYNMFMINIYPVGTNLNFHYEQSSVILDNGTNSNLTPVLINNTGYNNITYSSSDNNVATVNEYGAITYVSNGNCTVTASIDDGNNTTATITVYCSSM